MPAKNSTFVTVPSASLALAVTAISDPTANTSPSFGLVMTTVGAWFPSLFVTVIAIGMDVALAPELSVAFAVSV